MKCIGCKELDYPVISFRNTKVQDKLKGKNDWDHLAEERQYAKIEGSVRYRR